MTRKQTKINVEKKSPYILRESILLGAGVSNIFSMLSIGNQKNNYLLKLISQLQQQGISASYVNPSAVSIYQAHKYQLCKAKCIVLTLYHCTGLA
jgi:hypothetical protein